MGEPDWSHLGNMIGAVQARHASSKACIDPGRPLAGTQGIKHCPARHALSLAQPALILIEVLAADPQDADGDGQPDYDTFMSK